MLADLQKKAQQLLTENASAILTAGGVVGTVGTAILTGRASFRAANLIHEKQIAILGEGDDYELTRTDKIKIVWPMFIPPAVVGSATVGSIIMANQVSAKRAAALAAAYGISENRLQEYKDKVAEKLTGPKRQAIEDEIAQDRVNSDPPSAEVLVLASGEVLCYDMLTGRYFKSSVEEIKKAENRLNYELFHHQYASLSFFYEEIGLPPTGYTDEVGWSMVDLDRGQFEVKFSTVLSPDGKPCLAVDFNNAPHPEYTKSY